MHQIRKVSNFQLQEAQKEINSELMLAGFQLSDEDCKILYETVQKACLTYDMVESDPLIFFQFVQWFYDTPYLKATTLIPTIQGIIHLYYGLRCLYSATLRDDDLIQYMKQAFLLHHGVNDDAMGKSVMKLIKREMCEVDDSTI